MDVKTLLYRISRFGIEYYVLKENGFSEFVISAVYSAVYSIFKLLVKFYCTSDIDV